MERESGCTILPIYRTDGTVPRVTDGPSPPRRPCHCDGLKGGPGGLCHCDRDTEGVIFSCQWGIGRLVDIWGGWVDPC